MYRTVYCIITGCQGWRGLLIDFACVAFKNCNFTAVFLGKYQTKKISSGALIRGKTIDRDVKTNKQTNKQTNK